MAKRLKILSLAVVACPLFQLAGCALFGGGLVERTLSGAVINPLTQQVFNLFFSLANAGAGIATA